MAQHLSSFNRKFLKFGLPFLLLIVGGSFGLKEFAQIRYEFTSNKKFDRQLFKYEGIDVKEPEEVTLESEYEKIKDLKNQDWENKRGPRPWESDDEKPQ